jgi:hypothetical protein
VKKGIITPPELLKSIDGSPAPASLSALVMIVFTPVEYLGGTLMFVACVVDRKWR